MRLREVLMLIAIDGACIGSKNNSPIIARVSFPDCRELLVGHNAMIIAPCEVATPLDELITK
jgi:hypothetical protein